MKPCKNWKEVIDRVDVSGLDVEKDLKRDTFQRYFNVQRQLEKSIREAQQRRKQYSNQKIKQRQDIQTKIKNQINRQTQIKLKYREKEENLRNQNFKIMNQLKNNLEADHSKQKIGENPITAALSNQNKIRIQERKIANKQYNEENLKLISERLTTKVNDRNNNAIDENMFMQYMEESSRKRDQDRYKFKLKCLQSGNPGQSRMGTQADSLQKKYSYYLNQQISDKSRGKLNFRIGTQKIEDILDTQIEKLNSNPQIQSASPAYLGRIPYSHDRKKQLEYLDKQIKQHARVKTQFPYVKDFMPSQSSMSKVEKYQYGNNNSQLGSKLEDQRRLQDQRKQAVTSRNDHMKREKSRNFRQFNIFTGEIINKSFNYL